MIEPTNTTRRFEMTLSKPKLGWFPNPTVVVNGDAQPTLWGTRNWKVPGEDSVQVEIFVFNRLWKFGQACFTVSVDGPQRFAYRAPLLPFGGGKITALP